MRVIVAGSRTFNDYGVLSAYCDRVLSRVVDVEIVSGGARGADSLGELYARERGYPVRVFPAEWEKYGRGAGLRRNVEMAEYADGLIAFWDGESRGTMHMVGVARERGLRVRICRV